MSVGVSGEVGVFGGWIDAGVLGGAWTKESGNWTDELVYLVSVGLSA